MNKDNEVISKKCRSCSVQRGAYSSSWRGGGIIARDRFYRKLKNMVLSAYSQSGIPECVNPYTIHKTKIIDLDVLTLDHINGGGCYDTKHNGNLYFRLKREKYPPGFQVLCYNCQAKKTIVNHEKHKYVPYHGSD